MTKFEEKLEDTARHPDYDAGRSFTPEEIANNKHRKYVGGRWEEAATHQHDFLVQQGLEPQHRFLDVACGSFRAGRRLIEHLNPGNYYGVDINADLLSVGYDEELTDEQRSRLPTENLRVTDRFDCDFGVGFDMAIAQSLFTHVSLNHTRLCMYRVAKVMNPGGKFYATFNERSSDFPVDGFQRKRATERNPFWYYAEDMRWASSFSPWKFRYIGDWGHPRQQKIVELTRLEN